MYPNLLSRFLRYVKINTRSDHTSTSIPSTTSQIEFAQLLKKEMEEIGLEHCAYFEKNGYVMGTLPSNIGKEVPVFGLIAHMDTANFSAENIRPQVVENYDGTSSIPLGDGTYELTVEEFPNLKNYAGQTLITTDGTTLLGADDKAGIAEIMTAMEYLITHPEIPHGTIRIAFGPDEEIGTGADHFDVKDFGAEFAYTIDGGPVGELVYETFNAAQAKVKFIGRSVHTGTAKGKLISALQLAIDFHNQLPEEEVPEKTEGYEGFYHLSDLNGTCDEAESFYILRDFDREKLEEKKANFQNIARGMNAKFDTPRVVVELKDEYYNMREVIEKDLSIVELAEQAMKNVGITPAILPTRGGTDGSKISFMGVPTPNIFAGGENMHGRYEFVALESMEKATQMIIEMARLQAESE